MPDELTRKTGWIIQRDRARRLQTVRDRRRHDHAIGAGRGESRLPVGCSCQPSGLQNLLAIRRGVPDLDRAEVRQIGAG